MEEENLTSREKLNEIAKNIGEHLSPTVDKLLNKGGAGSGRYPKGSGNEQTAFVGTPSKEYTQEVKNDAIYAIFSGEEKGNEAMHSITVNKIGNKDLLDFAINHFDELLDEDPVAANKWLNYSSKIILKLGIDKVNKDVAEYISIGKGKIADAKG
jgi:hypothetical protein